MTLPAKTRLLDTIAQPSDLKGRSRDELKQIADEVRSEVIDAVSVTGGHLGAGLGVVELTVAIHSVFDTPDDKLIFDVGHQCYPHKILTGRKDRIRTLRQGGGLSGFTKRAESEYDPFGAAHASTSISAGLGFAKARDLTGKHNKVVCVIGDGAMSAGMAYEAMNNAGSDASRMLVILNDNDMSISRNVGGLSNYFAKLLSSRTYNQVRDSSKKVLQGAPHLMALAKKTEEHFKGMISPGTLFEELGFNYIGPIDGHDGGRRRQIRRQYLGDPLADPVRVRTAGDVAKRHHHDLGAREQSVQVGRVVLSMERCGGRQQCQREHAAGAALRDSPPRPHPHTCRVVFMTRASPSSRCRATTRRSCWSSRPRRCSGSGGRSRLPIRSARFDIFRQG